MFPPVEKSVLGGSSSVGFTIDPSVDGRSNPLPELQAEGLPTGVIIAAGTLIIVTIVTAGLFLYFKKRKQRGTICQGLLTKNRAFQVRLVKKC